MDTRAKGPTVELHDAARFRNELALYFGDSGNPTATPPLQVIRQRFQRIARVKVASLAGVFEAPVAGEKYVLYPIHFQPEASTLVQAPMYLDQIALLQDIARSLPIGYRLYVKEHVSNRGRRPLEFYQAIRAIHGTRLLGPDEDTWSLIRNASAIAVITGTMGWEGLFFDKPVVTFGDVFYNILPGVTKASQVPKDGWFRVFKQAIDAHRPDRESLLALVAALQERTYPGFMKNPNTFPAVLVDENVENITRALADAAGLTLQAIRPPRSEAVGPRT
jgi:capsule polysaccharide export protein KpsC/LpsZ